MSYLGKVYHIRILEHEKQAHEQTAKFLKQKIQQKLNEIAKNIDIENHCRPMTHKDVVVGKIVVGVGDYGNYCHIVEKVIKPTNPFKAYVASDGCRYGLSDSYIILIQKSVLKN